jgi:hypothetical protein
MNRPNESTCGGASLRGLLVRDPHASQLLDGEKIWEIRSRPTHIRGPILIIKSGTGKVFGAAYLVRVLGPLSLEDLVAAPELPLQEREEIRCSGLPYPETYAYVLSNPTWFERPIPYRHPSGAVTWVRLSDVDLKAVRFASSREALIAGERSGASTRFDFDAFLARKRAGAVEAVTYTTRRRELAVTQHSDAGSVESDQVMTRSERRSWKLHCQLSRHLTVSTLAQWQPIIARNLRRLRAGVVGQPHIRNLERWQSLLDRGDIATFRCVLTGVDRDSIEMREVSPMAGLLSEKERISTLQISQAESLPVPDNFDDSSPDAEIAVREGDSPPEV